VFRRPGTDALTVAPVAPGPERGDLRADRRDLLTVRSPRRFVSEVERALLVLEAIELLQQALLLCLVGCRHPLLRKSVAAVTARWRRITRMKTNAVPSRAVKNARNIAVGLLAPVTRRGQRCHADWTPERLSGGRPGRRRVDVG
jgi:hypothetical protein